MARTIDYDLQFKAITADEAAEVAREFKRERTYMSAKAAFTSAARSEAQGIDVALAKVECVGFTLYRIWTGAR
jgi:hypothetical protein